MLSKQEIVNLANLYTDPLFEYYVVEGDIERTQGDRNDKSPILLGDPCFYRAKIYGLSFSIERSYHLSGYYRTLRTILILVLAKHGRIPLPLNEFVFSLSQRTIDLIIERNKLDICRDLQKNEYIFWSF